MRTPRQIRPYGPTALLLDWEQRIAPDISASVHAWAAAARGLGGVVETVPAYASLLVRYDPALTTPYALRERLYELRPPAGLVPGHAHRLPVCYDGPDLDAVAELTGLTPDAVVERHAGVIYRVYQLGFLPGFAFLGQTPVELTVPRRTQPRVRVAAGAVGLAGRQTGVYPTASPGGWQLIGRCPLPLLRAGADPVRLRAGDTVEFYPVTTQRFAALTQKPLPWPTR